MGAHVSGRRSFGVAAALLVFVPSAFAHDLWINRERRVNANGEWCCNQHDCFPIAPARVKENGIGFELLDNGEVIPYREAQSSGDGQYWICRRPDKTRRCFFFPPPAS